MTRGPENDNPDAEADETQRLDKWLWYARQLKTRTLATRLVGDGKVRVNREKTDKPSQAVRAGDVITFTVNRRIRVLKVLAPGHRRGPASEAQMLYEDITPQEAPPPPGGLMGLGKPPSAQRRGRPTKRDRRQIDKLKKGDDN